MKDISFIFDIFVLFYFLLRYFSFVLNVFLITKNILESLVDFFDCRNVLKTFVY